MTIKKFDQKCFNFDKLNPEWNIVFLKSQLNYANDILNFEGCIFMRDICKLIGLPIQIEDVLNGWVKDKNTSVLMEIKELDDGTFDLRFNCEYIYDKLKSILGS